MGLYTDKRKMTHTPDGYELLTHESGHLDYNFKWHMGPYWSRYLSEMRDNKRIMGVKCSECGNVHVPPRELCVTCWKPMDEWVEVGPEGELKGFTIVAFPYIDANTGGMKQVPYCSIWIMLDGAYTRLMHFSDELDENVIQVGMRMRAVFAEDRKGTIHDVSHFEIIK